MHALNDLDMGEPSCIGHTRTKWKVVVVSQLDLFLVLPALIKAAHFWIVYQ